MGVELALKKILNDRPTDLEHFLSAFPTHLLFRTRIVKGVAGNALGKTEYVGIALAGALLGDSKWQIKKLIYDATGFQTDVIFADGSADFNKVMNNYASYTYLET